MYMVTRHELTSYQKDMWLEQCLYPGKPIYNLGGYAEFRGRIDEDLLARAVAAVITDNDVFRMKLVEKDGEPNFEMLSEVEYQVPFHDFSNREDPCHFCLEWMKAEFAKPIGFDGALFQFALLKPNADTCIWFAKIHHIIIDGWGISLVYRKIYEHYNRLAAGAGAILTETRSYTDFMADNREYRNSQAFIKDGKFWREKYRTMPEPLFNRSNGSGDTAGDAAISDRVTFSVERSLYDKIVRFSEENGCSVFHYILAVLFTYFSRLCQRDEIVIGVPVLNRGKAKYKETIGLFTNVVPLRLSPGKGLSFAGLMLHIKRELMECYRHQKFPFGEICRAAFSQAKERRNIFDISLSFMGGDFAKNYTKFRITSMPHNYERNALTIFVREYDDQDEVYLDFDYQPLVFDKFVPIDNVISHFRHLMAEMVGRGGQKVSETEIVPAAEKRKILHDFNNTRAEYPRDKTAHRLFEDQVQRTPDIPAVTFEGKKLTYGELNAAANRLAVLLRNKGVKPDGIAAIMTERSLEMVIGVLAVLKAGGAYLPIDPNYPPERIRYMLEDSRAAVLLTQNHLKDTLGYPCEIIDIEDGSIFAGDDGNPENVNKPNDLAYIIYTSGSTGKPKGVMVEHRGIANLAAFYRQTCNLGVGDKMLQFASSSFDASVWEMFASLLAGSTLCLVSRETINNFIEFVDFVNTNGITITLLPPTYLAGIEPEMVTGLKRLITGGSAITWSLVNKWKDRLEYMNAYGPTESTVIATTWKYRPRECGHGPVPIGTPISNTEVFILDGNDKLMPIGAAGEVCISGDGLARGYLHRPELTAEKFVPNPHRPGRRMYRTGDLARWLPDGNIEFLGRLDHQVKIRGFRIEPGEIESRLLGHEAVKEAAVTARDDGRGNKYLAAYIVADRTLTAGEVRAHLSEELPDYMVPHCIVPLSAMPLTPNGKIDVKALPEPDGGMDAAAEYVAPRNETEAILVGLWKEVLKTEDIGIRDNFFSLGGDSVKAIQVLSRLNGYGLKLKMNDLFRHPVIEELSGLVESAERIAEQGVVEGDLAPTPIQRWLFEQPFTEKSHFNQAVMLHRKEGFDEAIFGKVLTKLAEHHDALRMVVKSGEGSAVLYNRGLEGKLYTLDVADLTTAHDYQAAVTAEANSIQKSMDLENGPLFKAALFRTGDGDHLLIAIHHLLVDAVSWRIILQDLARGYIQASRNEEIKFPPKTDSFKRWSDGLAAYADSRELRGEAACWAAIEALQAKPLPRDRCVAERKFEDRDQVQAELSAEETEMLLKRSNAAYNTGINDLLLTALGLAVREWTGEDLVLVNLEGHGREEIIKDVDVSRTVGWFTAQYPVALDMGGEPDLPRRIKSVKETLRRIPNNGIGHGILKYLTSPENRNSLLFRLEPEISFNYLGRFDGDFDDSVFSVSGLSAGQCVSPRMNSPYAIDINGMVIKGKLTLSFAFDRNEYQRETMGRVAGIFLKNLVWVISHCAGAGFTEMTPSDFTYGGLTIDELDAVLGDFDRQNVKDIYLLSPMQEGMLYHALLDGESEAYFEQTAMSVKGRPDLGRLEESFNRLIARYDVLRTVFVHEKVARPLQVVLKEQRAKLQVEDATCLTESEQAEFVAGFRKKDKRRGFDLKRELPIRLGVIRTGGDSCVLIWSFHHIIMDGWCLGIVLKEFLEIYASLGENRQPRLGDTYPYSTYIRWLADRDCEAAASYWGKYLGGHEQQTSLLRRNSGGTNGRYAPADMTFRIDGEMKSSLEEIAGKNGVTLNTVIQAIWAIVLQRYNNTDDVMFGAVVSGRPHEIPGVENMVGLFINTLPVRINCDGNRGFAALLREVQQAALESERYGYYPLAEIRAAAGLKTALFDHILAFENYPAEEVINGCNGCGAGLAVDKIDTFEQTNYDFNVVVFPGRELTVRFSYNSMAYDAAFVGRLKDHFRSVAACVAADPETAVKDIAMLSREERRTILRDFNDTRMSYPKDMTVLDFFRDQAGRAPDNTAVVFADRRLSYRELNEKAGSLAGVLRNRGVCADRIVGVMAERSPEMIIGILAVLKAGGAYLPMDPAYPEERIAYMLEDSGAGILLTQKHLAERMLFDGETIDLEDPDLYGGEGTDTDPASTPRDLAYVIYTSGSTGKPKGVMIEHAGLANLVNWHRRVYNITPADRATQLAGQAFDASVWEIWPYLAAGASLHIPDNETRTSPQALIQWLKENFITVSFMPTPLAEALLDEEWSDDISLRLLLTGGDKLRRRPAKEMPFDLINHYGPTENTVVATWVPVGPGGPDCVLPPIGRPIDNTAIFIVDRNGRLQPVGAPGELCISGEGLARGYLNRPDMTGEKFVANPFIPGERMYRTGDLARWLPDGNIEFLGRIDHQVKIRGYRIEPGEIESRLLKHEAVKEAVVIAAEDGQGDKYLAAYIVCDRELPDGELREHLLTDLPEYMAPSCFTILDAMPLTPNGKIDRRALPEPRGPAGGGESHVPPRNGIDAQILKVWQEIFGRETIGIDDDFFLLGGNSIKAIQVASRLALDFEIGINDIYRCRTIRELSDKVKYAKGRLMEIMAVMREAAAARGNRTAFDGDLRSGLKKYHSRNLAYEKIDLAETADYRNVLLAGSTGYLGVHILYQLLKNTGYTVFVPVRGRSETEAGDRLRAKLEFYFGPDAGGLEGLDERVRVINGDLSEDYLGLSPGTYTDLANRIDCVINSAANVKHFGHFSEFYEVNVKGNERLAEFVTTGRKKAYNFISTTSVGSGYIEGKARQLFTEYDCDVGQKSDNFYVQTKLEAEKFLLQSWEEGLDVNIFRVGNLVFDSASGVFQENITDNAFYTLLKSLIKLGSFPEITDEILNFSFVDHVARAVVLLFDRKNLQNETHHLFNNNMVSMVSMAGLLRQSGVSVDTTPVKDFIDCLHARYEDEKTRDYITRVLVHSNMLFEGASKTSFVVLNRKTDGILRSLGFEWPELDGEKVRLMMEHSRKVGFM